MRFKIHALECECFRVQGFPEPCSLSVWCLEHFLFDLYAAFTQDALPGSGLQSPKGLVGEREREREKYIHIYIYRNTYF